MGCWRRTAPVAVNPAANCDPGSHLRISSCGGEMCAPWPCHRLFHAQPAICTKVTLKDLPKQTPSRSARLCSNYGRCRNAFAIRGDDTSDMYHRAQCQGAVQRVSFAQEQPNWRDSYNAYSAEEASLGVGHRIFLTNRGRCRPKPHVGPARQPGCERVRPLLLHRHQH